MSDAEDRAVHKAERRATAALAACAGLPTDTLVRIAALPVHERLAALAEAAQRRAAVANGRAGVEPTRTV